MSLINELEQIFRSTFDDPSIVVNDMTTADDIEGWDSLSHVHLIMAVERKFNIRFSATEIAMLENVGQLAEAVRRRSARK